MFDALVATLVTPFAIFKPDTLIFAAPSSPVEIDTVQLTTDLLMLVQEAVSSAPPAWIIFTVPKLAGSVATTSLK